MKVAIIITGEPRNYHLTHESFQRMFRAFNPDVYITSWDSISCPCNNSTTIKGVQQMDSKTLASDFNRLYNPKRIDILPKSALDDPLSNMAIPYGKIESIKHTNYTSLAQWFLISKAMRTLPKDTYDIVIRTRFDLVMKSKIADFHTMCKRLHGPLQEKKWAGEDTVLVPWIYITNNQEIFTEYAFMVGTYQGMYKLWFDAVNEIVQHIGTPHYSKTQQSSNPHHFLSMHMMRKRIPCTVMDQEYFSIQRS